MRGRRDEESNDPHNAVLPVSIYLIPNIHGCLGCNPPLTMSRRSAHAAHMHYGWTEYEALFYWALSGAGNPNCSPGNFPVCSIWLVGTVTDVWTHTGDRYPFEDVNTVRVHTRNRYYNDPADFIDDFSGAQGVLTVTRSGGHENQINGIIETTLGAPLSSSSDCVYNGNGSWTFTKSATWDGFSYSGSRTIVLSNEYTHDQVLTDVMRLLDSIHLGDIPWGEARSAYYGPGGTIIRYNGQLGTAYGAAHLIVDNFGDIAIPGHPPAGAMKSDLLLSPNLGNWGYVYTPKSECGPNGDPEPCVLAPSSGDVVEFRPRTTEGVLVDQSCF